MSSLQKIIIKSPLQNQVKPQFNNPICMKTFQLLPRIYGNIKIKKNNHQVQKLLFYKSNKQSQNNKSIKRAQSQVKQYKQPNYSKRQQYFKATIKQITQDKFSHKKLKLFQECKCKNKWSLRQSLSKNSRKSQKQIQIRKSNLWFQLQNQTKHKIKGKFTQNKIQNNSANKNEGLFSLIKQVNQKNQNIKNNPSKSEVIRTPRNSTHYKTQSMHMQEIRQEDQFVLQKIRNKIKQKKKQYQFGENSIGKHIKINKHQIQIEKFRRSQTQYNQIDQFFNDFRNFKNVKIANNKNRQGQTIFTIPSKQEISYFLRNYKPMLDNFNMNQIIKSQNFAIIYQGQPKTMYAGQIKRQLKSGQGIKITKFSIFQGQFFNGQKKYGIQVTKNGIYKGHFKNQKRQGQGLFKWNNGQTFEGKWQNNLKEGFGKWRSPKGDQYEGNWSQNKQNGYGVFKCQLSTYKGNFKDFLKNGNGQQTFKNGDKYCGQYKAGKPCGLGTYIWKDNQKYIGTFENGLRQGEGTLESSTGQYYKAKARLKTTLNTEKEYQSNLEQQLTMVYSNMENQFKKYEKYGAQTSKICQALFRTLLLIYKYQFSNSFIYQLIDLILRMNSELMENNSIFTNQVLIQTQRNSVKFNKTYALQPWDQAEFNPFLVTKYKNSKLQRTKITSLDYTKFRKKPNLAPILQKQTSKQLIRPSKQLPKLNIGLNKPTLQKKAKTVRSQKQNISPSHSISRLKPYIKLQYDKQLTSVASSLLPTVSRELNITRKIFLLQSKINGMNGSPSPQPKKQGTIRKLIEKQWQKKV